eukprot:911440-Ditylum_brightwellii.AAC.1
MKRKVKKRKQIEKANRCEEISEDLETAAEKSDDNNNEYKPIKGEAEDDESIASNVLVAEVVPKSLQIGQSGWSQKRAVRK